MTPRAPSSRNSSPNDRTPTKCRPSASPPDTQIPPKPQTRELLKKGQKIEKLALVQAWAEAGHLFDERERAAFAWAETVTRVAETGVPDQAYQAARMVFEERELVDLTIAIGLMNAYNRMAISFRNTPQAALEQ